MGNGVACAMFGCEHCHEYVYTREYNTCGPQYNHLDEKEARNAKARDRRNAIKQGKHHMDKPTKCNITKFDELCEAISELDQNFKFHNLNGIIINIAEFAVGFRDKIDERCSYCLKNKGHNFFPNHPDPIKTCYSCKCAHISMLTGKQALKKYPKLPITALDDLER
eukprot:413811_1